MAEKREISNTLPCEDILSIIYRSEFDALAETLSLSGYDEKDYSLLYDTDESMCLICNGSMWEVYFSERGNKTSEAHFEDINDACKYLLRILSSSNHEERTLLRKYHTLNKKYSLRKAKPKEVYDSAGVFVQKLHPVISNDGRHQ